MNTAIEPCYSTRCIDENVKTGKPVYILLPLIYLHHNYKKHLERNYFFLDSGISQNLQKFKNNFTLNLIRQKIVCFLASLQSQLQFEGMVPIPQATYDLDSKLQ